MTVELKIYEDGEPGIYRDKSFWKNYSNFLWPNDGHNYVNISVELRKHGARFLDYGIAAKDTRLIFKKDSDAVAFLLRWT